MNTISVSEKISELRQRLNNIVPIVLKNKKGDRVSKLVNARQGDDIPPEAFELSHNDKLILKFMENDSEDIASEHLDSSILFSLIIGDIGIGSVHRAFKPPNIDIIMDKAIELGMYKIIIHLLNYIDKFDLNEEGQNFNRYMQIMVKVINSMRTTFGSFIVLPAIESKKRKENTLIMNKKVPFFQANVLDRISSRYGRKAVVLFMDHLFSNLMGFKKERGLFFPIRKLGEQIRIKRKTTFKRKKTPLRIGFESPDKLQNGIFLSAVNFGAIETVLSIIQAWVRTIQNIKSVPLVLTVLDSQKGSSEKLQSILYRNGYKSLSNAWNNRIFPDKFPDLFKIN